MIQISIPCQRGAHRLQIDGLRDEVSSAIRGVTTTQSNLVSTPTGAAPNTPGDLGVGGSTGITGNGVIGGGIGGGGIGGGGISGSGGGERGGGLPNNNVMPPPPPPSAAPPANGGAEIVAEQVLCKFMIEHLDLPHSRQHGSTGHHNHHRAPKHVQYP